MTQEQTYHFEGGGPVEIITEGFHPAGAVEYTILHNMRCVETGVIVDITSKKELRQV